MLSFVAGLPEGWQPRKSPGHVGAVPATSKTTAGADRDPPKRDRQLPLHAEVKHEGGRLESLHHNGRGRRFRLWCGRLACTENVETPGTRALARSSLRRSARSTPSPLAALSCINVFRKWRTSSSRRALAMKVKIM
jgi:hypothetical protein